MSLTSSVRLFITIAIMNLCISVCGAHEVATSRAPIIDDNGSISITNAVLSNTSANCAEYAAAYYAEARDVGARTSYLSQFNVEVIDDTCVFTSNAIPNHDFNDADDFANRVTEQQLTVRVSSTPEKAREVTSLSLGYDNAILLNGVKVDLLAAGCFGVGDGAIGCFDMDTPYRYDPMSSHADFGTDTHNAHAQPSGEYHYHGNPNALFDNYSDAGASPVIGFAADGFPIFGKYFTDAGVTRQAQSSYQLKSGNRQGGPGGVYDGTFVDDYEYIAGLGDLDQCNGMTVNGVYGYYVTDGYPHILACFTGTPDESFRKKRGENRALNQRDDSRGGQAGLANVAEKLGVSVNDLRAALGRPLDVEASAKQLGVTTRELRAALRLMH